MLPFVSKPAPRKRGAVLRLKKSQQILSRLHNYCKLGGSKVIKVPAISFVVYSMVYIKSRIDCKFHM